MRKLPNILIICLLMGFLWIPIGSKASTISLSNNKLQHARQIFNRLVEARGDKSLPAPELLWEARKARGAVFLPGTNKIMLEAEAYKICMSFGDRREDALAYLLSHELIHYYKGHGWEAAFADAYSGTAIAAAVDEQERDEKQQETESDLLGGFLAYTAGFNTAGIGAQLYPKLYEAYPKWPKEGSAIYPSMQERVLIAQDTEKKLKDLIEVFETANYLVALRDFDGALDFYEHILENYSSPEIHNNLGVVACMLAMSKVDINLLKYLYPLELDAVERFRNDQRNGEIDLEVAVYCDSLLSVAIRHFNDALTLNADYHTGVLNLGCAYALRGFFNAEKDPQKQALYYNYAAVYAEDALLRGQAEQRTKLIEDAYCLKGIIAAEQSPNEAKAFFEEAAKRGSLGQANLAQHVGTPLSTSAGRTLTGAAEFVDDYNLKIKFMQNRIAPDPGTMRTLNKRKKRQWGTKRLELDHSRILIDYVSLSDVTIIHTTQPGYSKKTKKGIAIGASREEIEGAYGLPSRTYNLTNGTFLVYDLLLWSFGLMPKDS